jgi:hypothetical protein
MLVSCFKVVGLFPRPYASMSYVHHAAFYIFDYLTYTVSNEVKYRVLLLSLF